MKVCNSSKTVTLITRGRRSTASGFGSVLSCRGRPITYCSHNVIGPSNMNLVCVIGYSKHPLTI